MQQQQQQHRIIWLILQTRTVGMGDGNRVVVLGLIADGHCGLWSSSGGSAEVRV